MPSSAFLTHFIACLAVAHAKHSKLCITAHVSSTSANFGVKGHATALLLHCQFNKAASRHYLSCAALYCTLPGLSAWPLKRSRARLKAKRPMTLVIVKPRNCHTTQFMLVEHYISHQKQQQKQELDRSLTMMQQLTRICRNDAGLLRACSLTASGEYFCTRLQTPFSICSCSYAASHTLQGVSR